MVLLVELQAVLVVVGCFTLAVILSRVVLLSVWVQFRHLRLNFSRSFLLLIMLNSLAGTIFCWNLIHLCGFYIDFSVFGGSLVFFVLVGLKVFILFQGFSSKCLISSVKEIRLLIPCLSMQLSQLRRHGGFIYLLFEYLSIMRIFLRDFFIGFVNWDSCISSTLFPLSLFSFLDFWLL